MVAYTVDGLCQLRDAAGNLLLDLHDQSKIYTTKVDIPFPAIRKVSENRTGQSGTRNLTKFHGDRAVVWTGEIPDNTDYNRIRDIVAGLMNPGLRIYIHMRVIGWPQERRVQLVSDDFPAPIAYGQTMVAAWRGIDGVMEDITEIEKDIGASELGSPLLFPFIWGDETSIWGGTASADEPDGLEFDVAFDADFGLSGSSNAFTINNPGNTDTPPLIRIYGPCTGPTILCTTSGKRMSFPNVTLGAGEYLDVDCAEKEALLGGNPLSPAGWDLNVSSWFTIPTGVSSWQFLQVVSGAGSKCRFFYRPRFL